jgi:hypothetical protein
MFTEKDLMMLHERGWFIKNAPISRDILLAVRQAALALYHDGVMTPASSLHAHNDDPHRDRNARGDNLYWYDDTST